MTWRRYNSRMIRTRAIATVLAGWVLATAVWTAAKDKDAAMDPKELISRALQKQELWVEGTPALLLHGEVRIWERKGNVAKGEYTYSWISPSRWREEIRFLNYQRIRIGDAGGYWQKSDLEYEPEMIFNLEKVLYVKDALRVNMKQTLTKVKAEKDKDSQKNCTDVKWPSATEKTLCFDEADGTLASVEYHRIDGQHAPEVSRLEFDKYATVGDKRVPQEVRALSGTNPVASLNVLELTPAAQMDPALFNPPDNAEHWATCKDVQGRELLSSDPPIYPPGSKAKLEQGRVIYYVVVEGDGTLSHEKLIQGATPALDAVTRATLNEWRYKPAACGKTPVRTETSISMDFWLGG